MPRFLEILRKEKGEICGRSLGLNIRGEGRKLTTCKKLALINCSYVCLICLPNLQSFLAEPKACVLLQFIISRFILKESFTFYRILVSHFLK